MSEQSAGERFGVSDEDWHVVTEGRVNVLLVGPPPITARLVDAMRPFFVQPIAGWIPASEAADHCETLLVEDADQMSLEEQRSLDGWLASGPRPQVVARASVPLFPLVEQGKFLASLYYRLNVVYLTFEPSGF